MEKQIQELLARAEAAERRQQEEQRRREEAERLQQEERRRRLEAEAQLQPVPLPVFLQSCHELLLSIDIVTDPTKTTKGPVTKPANRRVPSRMLIWDTFAEEQSTVWEKLYEHPSFLEEKLFPSEHQLEYVRQFISPITSEMDLRYFERETVENHVRIIIDRITENEDLKAALGLRGSVTFESHTNLGATKKKPVQREEAGGTLIDTAEAETGPSAAAASQGSNSQTRDAITRGQADRFCIYRQEGDEHVPAIAIEYKAPHKLMQSEITTGLTKEIQPARDVIDKESDDSEFYCKRLVAAVITQLFSYMVLKGVRYGYVCTGEAFIFVYILDDPSSVQCSVCTPSKDVKGTDDKDLQSTAVAQVLAFTIKALSSPPVSQQWHDAIPGLDVWPVEYADILEQTPPDSRPKRISPPYRGRRPRNLPRFRMSLRSRCRPSEDEDRSSSSPSPSPSASSSRLSSTVRRARAKKKAALRSKSSGKSTETPNQEETTNQKQTTKAIQFPIFAPIPAIKTRPYCTQQCLLALRNGGPLDPSCPNYEDHQNYKGKIRPGNFRSLIRTQLATDRGPDADCRPLYKAGSCGALFKVRHSSSGHTLVAKGVESWNLHKLKHEMQIYNKLKSLQGKCIPVCLGIVDLVPKFPYYYDEGIYTHMLFLSWAGESISKAGVVPQDADVSIMVHNALQSIHSKGILHGDAEPRNILWNPTSQHVMIVDFERSTIQNALSDVSANSGSKKRKLADTCFTKELQRIEAAFENKAPNPRARPH
ncbi:hypothetical protein H112_00352 [Trichophyton rubrum D6]|uniref:Serine/threonine protein kinase n=4 Tax=Trichophyton TaxID=5550 RepID=A0A178F9C5_TRIRU|nr:uncharacterized protein TERG_08278 [Trichophyton rubrum CBS 118892]EZF27673.1 hypothetical protein H100_00353 [Trichophyton rubrum MR850]EZF46653.1 hypothetical protein H102_00352 [Trichophyton rubrum CBS 100081]EZF57318.1 hypothetical protein H103_00351 [Trichophyton rubrum CBS 288.86]EZF68005.1 hypothetical protein H104_00351 [Trichophyton rubrum CBS 289.86]EZF78628.1 hypothetical protein H105_00347 [Trichophyton soudanense CBS 452.61]EZF89253.1 hypothetical protein H110_00355 [Trichophy